jgi:methyl-accepting chemotaxis protein
MFSFISRSLMGQLVGFFLLVSLVPLGIVDYLSFTAAKGNLVDQTLQRLAGDGEMAGKAALDYLEETAHDLKLFTQVEQIRRAALSLLLHSDSPAGKPQTEQAAQPAAKTGKELISELDDFFKGYIEIQGEDMGYRDYLLIADDGDVHYTLKKLPDLGANLKTGNLRESHLARIWSDVMTTGKTHFEDFGAYPITSEPAAFVGVPVFDDNKKVGAVLVVRMSPDRITQIVREINTGFATYDAYIVGGGYGLRTPSKEYGSDLVKTKVETAAAKEALSDKSGAGEAVGKDGRPILNAWTDCMLRESKIFVSRDEWGLIAQLDSAEAFGPVEALRNRMILITFVAAVVVVLLAYVLSGRLAKPISAISGVAAEISKGNLAVQVPKLGRKDEIGKLGEVFDDMVKNLRDQVGRILDGVNVLAMSATEISATVAQLTTSTAETSSSVMETTTTVEQVRQAARLASEKAKAVALSAQKAVQIAASGKQATDDTVTKMSLIKEQMESIGETVVRLSEHSQAIENIISTVQDLADQSNLLAVNASIEAARAGDQGKGFAVVAHEIKSLADQSKAATAQVRSILEDTRKWVSAVVMATEQGIKAVDVGVEQSASAGSSIGALATSVAESAQAAGVINSTTEQQFAGVGQVASAMTNIEQAIKQNLDGSTQLEEASRRLHELGASLKGVVEHYKVAA